MDSMLKNLMTQLVMMALAGGVGGWVGVQTTLAQVRAELQFVSKHVEELGEMEGKLESLRARTTRLEVLQETGCK